MPEIFTKNIKLYKIILNMIRTFQTILIFLENCEKLYIKYCWNIPILYEIIVLRILKFLENILKMLHRETYWNVFQEIFLEDDKIRFIVLLIFSCHMNIF